MIKNATTVICATLLLLSSGSGSAWGQQPFPTASRTVRAENGFAEPTFSSAAYRSVAYQVPLSAGSDLAMHRLPPAGQATSPIYVAEANFGRPHVPHVNQFEPACDGCRKSQCECGPRWVMSADLLWMSRSRARPQTMIESELGALVISESFNARELVFDARAGYRLSWGYDLLDGRAVELNAFSIFDQRAAADVSDTSMFFTVHNLSPAIATDAYTVNYVSNLHNGELNWWLDEFWGFRPMVGARWIRVREEFSILDTTDTSWDAFSEMQNDLIGAQVGVKARLWDGGNWIRLETQLKGGIYHNDVDYQASVVDAAGASQGVIRRSPSANPFVGEITVTAVVQFCPRLALRFGYHGLWMSDIGLAPNQADQSDIATGMGGDQLGSLNYQGGFAGLEANW